MSATRLTRPVETNEPVSPTDGDDLNRLRSLLLADDRVQLDARTAALENALAQAVTKDSFAERLTDELAKALKRAERNDPKAIARAISPAVVQSIRREIVNSREDMVEALYPITGRMVRAAVRDALSNLIGDLNKRLDALTSPALLKAHAKSIVFRKPASSFLIAESRNDLKLERGLLIDRQTGSLVHAWQSDTLSGQSEESALVSSMFAAISTFTAENYDGPDAELRTLDLNGRQVALRHSARHVLVIEHTGAMQSETTAHIDMCFEQIVESVDDDEALAAIPLLADQHQATQANRRNLDQRSPAKLFFAALALIVFGLLAWHVWDRVWFAGKTELVVQSVAEQAPFHAPDVQAQRIDRTITVRGLVPPGFSLLAVTEQLAQAGVTLNNKTQPVAGATDLSDARRDAAQQLSLLTNELEALKSTILQQNEDFNARLGAGLTGIADQLTAEISTVRSEQAALATRIDGLTSGVDTLRTRFAAQADVLVKQDGLASEQASAMDRFATLLEQQAATLDQQRQALAVLDQQATGTGDQLGEFTAQVQAQLDAQQAAASTSQRTMETLQEQVRRLTAAQKRAATDTIEATRIRFADESEPEEPTLVATQIAQVVSLAQTHDFDLLVQGYSDQTGTDPINERISLARAETIVLQLVQAGFPPQRLRAQGLGAVADADGNIARQVRLRVVERDR